MARLPPRSYESEGGLLKANDPTVHHVAGAVLCGASWFTLLLMVAIDVAGVQSPKGSTVDWLFGVPAMFRVVGWGLLAWRGTWVSLAGLVVDLALVLAVFIDAHGDIKGNLLLGALFLCNAIPAWWSLTGRRLGGLVGVAGAVLTAAAWFGAEARVGRELFLPMLSAAVVATWLADAAIAWWALQVWRAENLEPDRQLD